MGSQVEELTKDKAELERENEVIKAKLQLLEQQNRSLIANQSVQGLPAPRMRPFMEQGRLMGFQPNMMLQGQPSSSFGLPSPSLAFLKNLGSQNGFGLASAPTSAFVESYNMT